MRFAGKIISALPVLIIAVSTLAHAANEWIGRASVIDADTIEIHGTRIRIHGIPYIDANSISHNMECLLANPPAGFLLGVSRLVLL